MTPPARVATVYIFVATRVWALPLSIPLRNATAAIPKATFVIVQERMQFAAGLVAGECLDADGVQAVENALFDVRVFALEPLDERLDFLALAAATAVVADGAVFGKTAGALDKLQPVVIFPVDNVLLVDAIHGADEFHAAEI